MMAETTSESAAYTDPLSNGSNHNRLTNCSSPSVIITTSTDTMFTNKPQIMDVHQNGNMICGDDEHSRSRDNDSQDAEVDSAVNDSSIMNKSYDSEQEAFDTSDEQKHLDHDIHSDNMLGNCDTSSDRIKSSSLTKSKNLKEAKKITDVNGVKGGQNSDDSSSEAEAQKIAVKNETIKKSCTTNAEDDAATLMKGDRTATGNNENVSKLQMGNNHMDVKSEMSGVGTFAEPAAEEVHTENGLQMNESIKIDPLCDTSADMSAESASSDHEELPLTDCGESLKETSKTEPNTDDADNKNEESDEKISAKDGELIPKQEACSPASNSDLPLAQLVLSSQGGDTSVDGVVALDTKADIIALTAVTLSPVSSVSSEHRKSSKNKSKSPPDTVRPVGRLLYDIGLDIVRQEVYKDLIDIQVAKDSDHRLDDKEKGQLVKLTEAHSKLKARNSPYLIGRVRCARCRYSCTSENVLHLHKEHGHCTHAGAFICCACDSFRTRYPSQFLTHMETVHKMNGRLAKKLSSVVCSYCPYEHKNTSKVEMHAEKCIKKFQLNTNLQPLPSDCDIPIRHRPMGNWTRPPSIQYDMSQSPSHLNMNMAGVGGGDYASPRFQGSPIGIGGSGVAAAAQPSPTVMEIGGQLYSWGNHNGKPLLTSLRSQVGSGPNFSTTSGLARQPVAGVNARHMLAQQFSGGSVAARMTSPAHRMPTPPQAQRREMCEICSEVLCNRQALWTHLHSAHKLELSRVSMSEQEPGIACEMCKGRFWTYQGLARHSLLLHKRNLGGGGMAGGGAMLQQMQPRPTAQCHLCGASQTSNPLNHLSTQHNVTLLDMYHNRQCCMCNRKLRTGRAFEDHMIQEHRDIFANLDVLRTVLQALSTALYLKSEDNQQQYSARAGGSGNQQRSALQTQQQRYQYQQCQQQQTMMANIARMQATRPQQYKPVVGQNNTNRFSAMTNAGVRTMSKATSVSNASPSMGQKTSSPSVGQKSSPARAKESPVTASQAASIPKVLEKKVPADDSKALSKLYEDYADIGRPISRSMKHKLLVPPSGAESENPTTGSLTGDEKKSNLSASTCDTSTNDTSEETKAKKSRLAPEVAGGEDNTGNDGNEEKAVMAVDENS